LPYHHSYANHPLIVTSDATYITDIAVDDPNGLVYVTTDDNILYEVDSTSLLSYAFHNTSGYTEYQTLFIAKRNNNRRVLYAFLDSDEDEDFNFVFYPLPLANQDVLVPRKSKSKCLSPPSSPPLFSYNSLALLSLSIIIPQLST
jgi:hypothetical protein